MFNSIKKNVVCFSMNSVEPHELTNNIIFFMPSNYYGSKFLNTMKPDQNLCSCLRSRS